VTTRGEQQSSRRHQESSLNNRYSPTGIAIAPPSATHRQAALTRQSQLTKPAGSLGVLEQLAVSLAAQQQSEKPSAQQICITVFAADHGVCAEGISAFPQAVTGQMIANFANGGAAICVMAKQLGAQLEVVNLGTATPVPDMGKAQANIHDEHIAAGTANLATHAAISDAQLQAALTAGDRAAQRALERHCNIFIGGEMGIGNTTSAAAIACAVLDEPASTLAGPGTGLNAQGVAHKADVIERALKRHFATVSAENETGREPLTVLASLGGFEIAALTGAIIGCAARGIPVLVDGFIVSVAALVAVRLRPDVSPWLHFAHHSEEPGHTRILQALNAKPLLNLGMRLGEGSGAAVAVSLLRSACALHNNMATFADAGVSDAD
jgi:nicotinate-nucleotide--dimethylbenzimidazole phosphoribosyltransferase